MEVLLIEGSVIGQKDIFQGDKEGKSIYDKVTRILQCSSLF